MVSSARGCCLVRATLAFGADGGGGWACGEGCGENRDNSLSGMETLGDEYERERSAVGGDRIED